MADEQKSDEGQWHKHWPLTKNATPLVKADSVLLVITQEEGGSMFSTLMQPAWKDAWIPRRLRQYGQTRSPNVLVDAHVMGASSSDMRATDWDSSTMRWMLVPEELP